MNRLSIPLAAVLSLLPAAAPAASAPAALQGKSIVVTWSESRVQRQVGEAGFRNVTAGHQFRAYVSSAGRVFSRLTNTTRLGSGTTEQVSGSGGGGIPTRVPAFSGQTMTVFAPFQAGGMRRISVEFAGGFGSCSAKVTFAQQAGVKNIAYSPIAKTMVEFQSVSPGAASCSIQAGNVFGGS